MPLPPGFELEQRSPKLPEGFELEAPNLPPGFELEGQGLVQKLKKTGSQLMEGAGRDVEMLRKGAAAIPQVIGKVATDVGNLPAELLQIPKAVRNVAATPEFLGGTEGDKMSALGKVLGMSPKKLVQTTGQGLPFGTKDVTQVGTPFGGPEFVPRLPTEGAFPQMTEGKVPGREVGNYNLEGFTGTSPTQAFTPPSGTRYEPEHEEELTTMGRAYNKIAPFLRGAYPEVAKVWNELTSRQNLMSTAALGIPGVFQAQLPSIALETPEAFREATGKIGTGKPEEIGAGVADIAGRTAMLSGGVGVLRRDLRAGEPAPTGIKYDPRAQTPFTVSQQGGVAQGPFPDVIRQGTSEFPYAPPPTLMRGPNVPGPREGGVRPAYQIADIGRPPVRVEQPVITLEAKPGDVRPAIVPSKPPVEDFGGQVSFAAPAEAGAIPSARQVATGMDPNAIKRLLPAVKIAGKLMTGRQGESHDEILRRNGFDPEQYDHFSKVRGFALAKEPGSTVPVNQELIPRGEAQTMSGYVGTAKAGGLDSQDLPGGQRNIMQEFTTQMRDSGYKTMYSESGIRAKGDVEEPELPYVVFERTTPAKEAKIREAAESIGAEVEERPKRIGVYLKEGEAKEVLQDWRDFTHRLQSGIDPTGPFRRKEQDAIRELRAGDIPKAQPPGDLQKVGQEIRPGAEETRVARQEEAKDIVYTPRKSTSFKNLLNQFFDKPRDEKGRLLKGKTEAERKGIFAYSDPFTETGARRIEDVDPVDLRKIYLAALSQHVEYLDKIKSLPEGAEKERLKKLDSDWDEVRANFVIEGALKGANITGTTLESLKALQENIRDYINKSGKVGGPVYSHIKEAVLYKKLRAVGDLIREKEASQLKELPERKQLPESSEESPGGRLYSGIDLSPLTDLIKFMATKEGRGSVEQVMSKWRAAQNAMLIGTGRASTRLKNELTDQFPKQETLANKAVASELSLSLTKDPKAVSFAAANRTKVQGIVNEVEQSDQHLVQIAKRAGVEPEPLADFIKGLTPDREFSASDVVELRTASVMKTVNDKLYYRSFQNVLDPTTKLPLTEPLVKGKAPAGYVKTDSMEMAVLKGYENVFATATGESALRQSLVGKAVLETKSTIKHLKLAFDFYHLARESVYRWSFDPLSMRAPYRKGLAILENSRGELQRSIDQGKAPKSALGYANELVDTGHGKLSRYDLAHRGIKTGLEVGRHSEALYTSFIRDTPVLKQTVGKAQRFIFDQVTRGAILESYLTEVARLGKKQPNTPLEVIERKVAKDINFRFGNIGKEGLIKSDTWRDISQLIFLAPAWFESQVQSEVRAAGQLAKTIGTGGYKPLGSLGRSTLNATLLTFAVTQAVNIALNGKFTWQNSDNKDHQMDAFVPPLDKEDKGFHISPFAMSAEITHDIKRYRDQGLTTKEAFERVLKNKLDPIPRAITDFATGKDYKGDIIENQFLHAVDNLAPLPLPLQQAKESGRQKSLVPLERQAFSMLGTKAEPETTAEQRSRLAEGKGILERYSQARKERLERPPVSREQRNVIEERAIRAEALRGTELTESLSKADRNWLSSRNLIIPGYKTTISVEEERLPLTQKEQARLKEIFSTTTTAAIGILRRIYDQVEDPDERRKLFNEAMRETHKAAREAFEEEMAASFSKVEQNKQRKRFSAFDYTK